MSFFCPSCRKALGERGYGIKECPLSLPPHHLTEALINISWDPSARCSPYSWRGSEGDATLLQGQGAMPGLLTPLQGSTCCLAEVPSELSPWAELLVFCLELLPYSFPYLSPMYPLELSLNIYSLGPHLDLLESLCVLLSQQHPGQRLLIRDIHGYFFFFFNQILI